MAQVVDAEALNPGGPGGRLPDAAVEVAAPQVRVLAAQEHERLRRLGRVARQVLGQGLAHDGRQGDGAAARRLVYELGELDALYERDE